ATTAQRKKWPIGFWLAAGWLFLIVFGAIFAALLPLPGPNAIDINAAAQGPTITHLLGTDELGRDILSRLIWGARTSLIVGVVSVVVGISVGGLLGVMAGYTRGRVDGVVSLVINVMLAFPTLIFALAAAAFLGPSLVNVVGIIAILSIAPFARFVRGIAWAAAQREYVTAARMLGYRSRRILLREVVPNLMPAILSFACVSMGIAIAVEGALSFLGLSVRPPTPTWGNMIAEGGSYLTVVPLLAVWPALCLLITILALNVLGERLRRRFDVREGGL
ncbi:MAG TPA: ABC transporter permease, partial [Streptosporangiaceae bacterium]|nr:ABC transporter permease [Streptosporangiaceae bacterium]